MMGVLYDANVRTVSEHLQKIFSDCELDEDSVIRKFRITAADGKTYDTKHYNLKAIIAVGYQVKSVRGTQLQDRPFKIPGHAANSALPAIGP
jgi:hypothetical protein